jgi:hypothetical protein
MDAYYEILYTLVMRFPRKTENSISPRSSSPIHDRVQFLIDYGVCAIKDRLLCAERAGLVPNMGECIVDEAIFTKERH